MALIRCGHDLVTTVRHVVLLYLLHGNDKWGGVIVTLLCSSLVTVLVELKPVFIQILSFDKNQNRTRLRTNTGPVYCQRVVRH